VRETQHSRFALWVYLDLAHLQATEGQFAAATGLADGQQRQGRSRTGFPGCMHRCQGYIQVRQGNWDAAIGALQSSLTCLEGTHLPQRSPERASPWQRLSPRNSEGDGDALPSSCSRLSLFRQFTGWRLYRQVQAELQNLPRQT